jgi:predicted ATP-dependent serine protease
MIKVAQSPINKKINMNMNEHFNAKAQSGNVMNERTCACGKMKEDWQGECSTCWKKNKDYNTNERISYAQSWNLSVASLSDEDKKSDSMTTVIEQRQLYFYEKLTNRDTIQK